MRDLMPRLLRPVRRRLRRDDRGTVAVLVAVLISAGVLLGIGALVIDVGQLYQNRAELQNGADAGALAVAKTCVLATCDAAVAAQYADLNASQLTGGAAAVDLVCGSGTLGACPFSTGASTDCPPPPSGFEGFADVHTSTLTSHGSTALPPVFARALLGNSHFRGTTVKACAQAAWGGPAAATVTALTVSECEWNQATNNGNSYALPPPYPPNPLPDPSFDQVLQLHGRGAGGDGCGRGPSGGVAPGNFGWTDDGGNCSLDISGPVYGGDTGVSVSHDCQTVLANAQANRTPIYIPVYTSVTGQGREATYTLDGFAAFVVTGYHMPSFFAQDWLNKGNDCSGSAFCLNGYFTQGLIPSSGSLGGPDLGAVVIRLTG
ncbi:MAG TPA: pilus assembly protein TadG-related protein [Streptosporangiaceae bacterium]